MISAVDALRLPSAQLSEEERAGADKLEIEIEIHIRKFMERRGCDFETKETRGNVIAEINQRLKAAGYVPQWKPLLERHKLNNAAVTHVGFGLSLAPSDPAYAAERILLEINSRASPPVQ